MNPITSIDLGSEYVPSTFALNGLTVAYDPVTRLSEVPPYYLEELPSFRLGELDTIVKNGKSLSTQQSFGGMLHVVAATNNWLRAKLFPRMSSEEAVAKGSWFLTLMAAKEAYVGLTAHEIAGMVIAGRLDIVYEPPVTCVFETCGMGADRGFGSKDLKTINVSSLMALVLASFMGYKALKHGSKGNTTKVGSSDVFMQFGALRHPSTPGEVMCVLDETNFWFSDAHAVKTLHYLSHLLKVETINHIVGPMTAPIDRQTRLFKVLGVNHFVHPETVAQAYMELHQLGVINLGGVVALAGIDQVPVGKDIDNRSWFTEHAYLDELGIRFTLAAVASPDTGVQTVIVDTQKTFGTRFEEAALKVPNTIGDLVNANTAAITGTGMFTHYLAINTAMALWSQQPLRVEKLETFATQAYHKITSGAVVAVLDKYVTASGGQLNLWK